MGGSDRNERGLRLKVEIVGSSGLITFCRPEEKNPLSIDTIEEVHTALDGFQESGVSKIVITGSGNTFAAGANIREVAALDSESALEFGRRGQQLMMRIHRFPVPVIAAIDGYCMGGALDLAVACKERIASPRSIFAHPGPKLGIMTGWGGTQLLPRLIGEKRALCIFLMADRIGAAEALELGLIDAIDDDPVGTALGRNQ